MGTAPQKHTASPMTLLFGTPMSSAVTILVLLSLVLLLLLAWAVSGWIANRRPAASGGHHRRPRATYEGISTAGDDAPDDVDEEDMEMDDTVDDDDDDFSERRADLPRRSTRAVRVVRSNACAKPQNAHVGGERRWRP